MEIKIINKDKKQFIDLLLLADEQESMIDRYLERGDLFALYDNDLKSICVVTEESPDTCELKSIATYEKWQNMGYAGSLYSIFPHITKINIEPCLWERVMSLPPCGFMKIMDLHFPTGFLISSRTITITSFLRKGYSLWIWFI